MQRYVATPFLFMGFFDSNLATMRQAFVVGDQPP